MLIHIIYDAPEEPRAKFSPFAGIIRFVGSNSDGWSRNESMRLSELPEAQKQVYLALASAIQGKGEDWAASQVWARIVELYAPEVDDALRTQEAVSLKVEARQDGTGAIRTFTPSDDPSLLVEDSAAVAFFKHFTAS